MFAYDYSRHEIYRASRPRTKRERTDRVVVLSRALFHRIVSDRRFRRRATSARGRTATLAFIGARVSCARPACRSFRFFSPADQSAPLALRRGVAKFSPAFDRERVRASDVHERAASRDALRRRIAMECLSRIHMPPTTARCMSLSRTCIANEPAQLCKFRAHSS